MSPSIMMSERPIQADHFAAPTPVIPTPPLTVARHQRLGGPARLKDRLMHSPSRRRLVIDPDLKIVDALQRFIRTQNQATHITTDVLKASLSTEHRTIRGETAANRFRNLDKR